jgi:hypothetical protein
MTDVLRGVINNASKDRTKEVIPLKPAQFTDSSGGKMVRAVNRGGNPLDKLTNRSFPPSQQGLVNTIKNQRPVEEMMEGQPLSNNKHIIVRDIQPLGPHVDSIDRFEMGFLHRKDTRILETVRIRDFRTIRDQPCDIISPANFNYELAQYQADLFESDEKAYFRLTAQDLWCENWSVDGIVEVCQPHGANGQGSLQGVLGDLKRATIVSRGPQACYNYWANYGDDVQPGSRLFGIIKRVQAPTQYILNNRYNTNVSGSSTARVAPTVDTGNKPFRPFQLCFCAVPPDCSYPTLSDVESTDEYGFQRWDSLVIYFGRAHFVPRRVQMTPLPRTTQQRIRRAPTPFTDANVGIDSQDITMLNIILNCDDGICPV